MKMMLKGCRRCGGDLFPEGSDRDRLTDRLTMSCLQCGLEVRLRVVSPPLRIPKVDRPIAA